VLSYVGICTSTGQALEIPILLRSLAACMGTIDEDQLSLTFDHDFLMTLDADLTEQHIYCRMVDNYECAWWNGRKPRSLNLAQVLDRSSLARCLAAHRDQIQQPFSTNSFSPATPATPATSSSSQIPPAMCPKCDEYKGILSNALLDIVNMHNYANLMLSTSEMQWNIDMRRASTFNQLYETSVWKETMTTSSAMAGISKETMTTSSALAGISRGIEESASKELHRLKNLPETSYKWTWGESLTKADVVALRRPGRHHKKPIHSGYDIRHKEGELAGQFSPIPTSFDTDDPLTADDAPAPPDNDIPAIIDFKKMLSNIYDPLGKLELINAAAGHSATLQPRILADLMIDNLIKHTLDADQRPSSYRDTPAKDDTPIENVWSSASREMEPGPSAAVPVVGHAIEDIWDLASEETQSKPSAAASKTRPDNVGETAIEDEWSPASYATKSETSEVVPETPADGGPALEDEWSSAGEEEVEVGPSATEDTPIIEIEDVWSSQSSAANDEKDSNEHPTQQTSQPTVNSQFMVSPSRITLRNSNSPFPFTDAWPDIDPLPQENISFENPIVEAPATASVRLFVPADFSYLQDHMFEQKSSDSEWSDEVEE
jgi:hypothetical protein